MILINLHSQVKRFLNFLYLFEQITYVYSRTTDYINSSALDSFCFVMHFVNQGTARTKRMSIYVEGLFACNALSGNEKQGFANQRISIYL